MTSVAFELGINYWPRRQAMYMWRELDLVEVRDEMLHIADMGFDTVRLFALTQDFLPEAGRVDAAMVNRLVHVVRIAAEARLNILAEPRPAPACPTYISSARRDAAPYPSWVRRTAA